MIRLTVFLVALLFAASSCSAAPDQPADPTNAVAAYIHVSDDRFEQDAVLDPIAHAGPGEPSSPAGFIPGLRLAGSQRALDGIYGWEFIFQADVTETQRLHFAGRAEALDLEVIWLSPVDEWPWCAGEADRGMTVDELAAETIAARFGPKRRKLIFAAIGSQETARGGAHAKELLEEGGFGIDSADR